MKTICFLFLTFLNFPCVFSQISLQWAHKWPDVIPRAIIQNDLAIDSIGNVYVTGAIDTSTNYYVADLNIATIKYDPSGNFIWERFYNGNGNGEDRAEAVATDLDGNVYMTGWFGKLGGATDWVTIKYDTNGEILWTREVTANGTAGDRTDRANDLAVDKDGNVYVTGYINPWDYGYFDSGDFYTVKYGPLGDVIWSTIYNTGSKDGEQAEFIALDSSANAYVTGHLEGNRIATVKYNSSGIEQWVAQYPLVGGGVTVCSQFVDKSGNVYLAGYITFSPTSYDYLILKYTSTGILDWERTYNRIDNGKDLAYAIAVDDSGNVYVTGRSAGVNSGHDIATVCYSASGEQKWVRSYNGSANGDDWGNSICFDNGNSIFVVGGSLEADGENTKILQYNLNGDLLFSTNHLILGWDRSIIITDKEKNLYISTCFARFYQFLTLKYSPVQIYEPTLNDKWLAGETDPAKFDTIKWYDTGWPIINIYCILNFGTSQQRRYLIAQNSTADSNYVWQIPDTLFSYKSKIMIENAADTSNKIYSEIFRLKPYHLTYVGPDSIYYKYEKDLDQWGFWNNEVDMWPPSWWLQFNYNDVDPFTGLNYPIWQGIFPLSQPYDFPDWVSWVNTFGINACYHNVSAGIYSEQALLKWFLTTKFWNGSCFGIAIANALAFSDRGAFYSRYNSFPSFIDPITIASSDTVRKIINELWTHQFGNPHLSIWTNFGLKKTPSQTIEELKQMLFEDEIGFIYALSIMNNSKSGGHTILPYKLRSDDLHPEICYIFTYDNSYPTSNNPIIVNTSQNLGNGNWNTLDWPGWGGPKWLALEDAALWYLSNPILPKKNKAISPFIMSDNLLEIIPSKVGTISIRDNQGNIII